MYLILYTCYSLHTYVWVWKYRRCCCAPAQSCPLFATPWTVALQASLSMGFSRQEYWSGLPFPSPGDLPNPEIETVSIASPTLEGRFFTTVPPGKPINIYILKLYIYIICKYIYIIYVKVKSLSRVQLFATPWTVAHQVPLSMEFTRQEYWNGLPFSSPGESSWPRDQTQVSLHCRQML